MDSDKKIIAGYQKSKELFDMLGGQYIYSWDKKIIYLVGEIVNYDLNRDVSLGNVLSAEEVYERSLGNLSLLGDRTKVMFVQKSQNRIIIDDTISTFDSCCAMGFSKSLFGKFLEVGNGRLYLSGSSYEMDAIVHAHEFVHFLKDSSLEEYRNNLYVEAIPIFLEILCMENNKPMAEEMFKRRNSTVTREFNNFRTLDFLVSQGKYVLPYDGKSVHHIENYLCTKWAGYVYSFYVAVILFNQYKVNPKRTLEMINDVIEHKCTTRVMFRSGLKIDNYDEVFEKEYSELKKVLK